MQPNEIEVALQRVEEEDFGADFDESNNESEQQKPTQKMDSRFSVLSGLLGAGILGMLGSALYYGTGTNEEEEQQRKKRRKEHKEREQFLENQINELTVKLQGTEQAMGEMADKLDRILETVSTSQPPISTTEEIPTLEIPGLDEIFPQFIAEVAAANKESVLKNLRMWLNNAVTKANNPIATRVNENNVPYKNYFLKNPFTLQLFEALGYVKKGAYFEVENQEAVQQGLDLVLEEYERLEPQNLYSQEKPWLFGTGSADQARNNSETVKKQAKAKVEEVKQEDEEKSLTTTSIDSENPRVEEIKEEDSKLNVAEPEIENS